MSKHVVDEAKTNTVSVINLVLLVLILILGLTGHFPKGGAGGMTEAQVTDTVKAAMKDAPAAVAPTPTPAPQPAQPTAPTKADQAAVDTFMETVYLDGNKDAKVTIIEFSDVQCPFCQRHTNNGTLDQVLEKYGDDVNVVFAHFPLSFHQNAQKAGEALECAGKIGGEEGFFSFKKAYFAKGGDSSIALAKEAATEAGIDATELETCVNGGEFSQKVKDQMAFGRTLGVTGTPGNIVLNNETLEFQKVSGAVPATAFDTAISAYLN